MTPNSLLFLNSNLLPDLHKRAKHLLKCKEAIWCRWTKEYLCSLRERRRVQAESKGGKPTMGDIVIIRSEDKNGGRWPLGIIEKLITGNDRVVRGVRIRAGRYHIEQPIQHLYPLELSCDKPQLAAPCS